MQISIYGKAKASFHAIFDDTYSGQSEAFRILAVLPFLLLYISLLPTQFQITPTVIVYCNNQGTIMSIT